MEYGEVEKNLIASCYRSKTPLPKYIRDAPELFLGLELFLNAFYDLSGDRQSGMGMGPIPYMSIVGYARHHEFDSDLTEELLHHIREMDAEFLAYHREQSKMQQKGR